MKKVFGEGQELNSKIIKGVNKLGNAVAATLGPKGRNVILQSKDKKPLITKDGVSVASWVDLEDPFENVGAQVIKQAAARTNANAGDGTTTSTVLAQAIINKAQAHIVAGASPTELKRGMEKGLEKVKEYIKEAAKPIASLDDVKSIATISANNDSQIGTLISLAVDKAGRDGAVTIEESRSSETVLDVVEGFQIDSGHLSQRFITDERKGSGRYTDALVLVTDHVIDAVEEMLPVLEVAAREKRPLVVVADDVSGQALAALVLNAVRGNMKVNAIKAPRYGEERRNILDDLAISVGATFITRESGMKITDLKRKDLGFAKMVESTAKWAAFVGGNGDPELIKNRIENLKAEIDRTSNLSECEDIQDRISRLQSAVAVIRVGGATEVDMMERKDRVVDALEAVKSAQAEGILAGGGSTLVYFSKRLSKEKLDLTDDEELGVRVLVEAMREPVKTIARNCGENEEQVLSKQLANNKLGMGFNFATGKFGDLIEQGVIDPARVTRCALENAVSAASTLLTTSHAIIEV